MKGKDDVNWGPAILFMSLAVLASSVATLVAVW